jgi:phospholipid/cholesterol/gamma-HCH transport system substrate-binding protein
MSKPRTELKVGIFVLIGLVFGAVLVISFNKGAGPLTATYRLRMQAHDVSGVIPGSFVLMAGVRSGSVEDIVLEDADGSVTIIARLLKKYTLRQDAKFLIRQSGFLGDQYIGVFQGVSTNALKDGDIVVCEEPFDLSEVARSAGGLIRRVDTMVGQVSNVVDRVETVLFSVETLTNLSATARNFRAISDRTLAAVNKIEALIDTNAPVLSGSISNAQTFTLKLNDLATDLRQTLATNRDQLTASVNNFEKATAKLDAAMADLNAGEGLAGALIKNKDLATDMSLIVSNLQVLSSNINNKGLWGVLRKPKIAAKK